MAALIDLLKEIAEASKDYPEKEDILCGCGHIGLEPVGEAAPALCWICRQHAAHEAALRASGAIGIDYLAE